MRGTLTHLATIEHYAETGQTIDDGAGGTIPQKEWTTVVDGQPCRYEPEGQGYVREDQGGRVYESPRVYLPARSVGSMADVSAVGDDAEYEYELEIDTGDEWRLTLAGVDGTFSLSDPDVHYKGPQRPSHVVIEVERVDADPEGV